MFSWGRPSREPAGSRAWEGLSSLVLGPPEAHPPGLAGEIADISRQGEGWVQHS